MKTKLWHNDSVLIIYSEDKINSDGESLVLGMASFVPKMRDSGEIFKIEIYSDCLSTNEVNEVKRIAMKFIMSKY